MKNDGYSRNGHCFNGWGITHYNTIVFGVRVTLQGVVRRGRNMIIPALPGAHAART